MATQHLNNGGRIISIKNFTKAHYQSGVYGMTKAALDNLSVQWTSKFGPRKITVNTIAPGPILTDMKREQFADEQIRKQVENSSAMRGIGDPGYVAGAAAFLASPDTGWITGNGLKLAAASDFNS